MSERKPEIVMDTNVAIVANGRETPQADEDCIHKCIVQLSRIRDTYCLLLDDDNLILTEYRRHLHPSGEPGPGDAFFKWLFENQARQEYCRIVPVHPHPDREFEEFPEDPDLNTFDRDDRKFVAVAVASGTSPRVLNASDTDWWPHRQALQRHDVEVVFLCPDLMEAQ